MNTTADLDSVVRLPMADRLEPLIKLAQTMLEQGANGTAKPVVALLVEALESGEGSSLRRLALGEVLGKLGDPRLRTPDDADYWVTVTGGNDGDVTIGRFPVTNAEFFGFAEVGYTKRELWSDEGWAWLQATEEPWPVLAAKEGAKDVVVANQPVVGVTFFEAEAYANHVGARIPRVDERVTVARGSDKRPYPWGAPFGEGNANTSEEVLSRPCAVGLFIRDCTPEGVYDLAGNVAEWMADRVGSEVLTHPGAWDQPSLASWGKALRMHEPDSRWAGLGFRLVR